MNSILSRSTKLNLDTATKMHFSHPPGSSPLDRYTIRRGIGVGGFGEVYFAVSEGGKEVALKKVQHNWEVELRGAGLCLNLKHPNLVSLHDVTRDQNDSWWIVMEYIAGSNLRDVLTANPHGLDRDEVHRWFSGVCRGVAHLHGSGLVHRDLKPGNLFDDEGVVKVGDYGLSKFISHTRRGGHTESVGTFHYMAPEVGRGEYGTGVDVYALGVILFELLTGEVPFDGESQHEIIIKHLSDQPDLTSIAGEYRSIVDRCLKKDPSDRFADAGELVAAFERCFEGSRVDQAAQEPVFAPESVVAATTIAAADPVARAVQHGLSDFGRWWRTLDRSPLSKAIFVVLAVLIAGMNLPWFMFIATILAIVYLPYYLVRNIIYQVRTEPLVSHQQTAAARSPENPTPGHSDRSGSALRSRPITRQQWKVEMRRNLQAMPSLDRLSRLNTSLIVAVLCTALSTGFAAIFGVSEHGFDVVTVAPYVAAALTALAATVGLLVLGRYWERGEGDAVTRRLAAGGVGALVGTIAAAAHEFLMLPSNEGLLRDVDATGVPAWLYRDGGATGATLIVYFALLFALLRTWRPVDPLRRKRVSLWSVAVSVIAAWAVHQIVPIPQPFGMLVAGVTAISAQLAAPWIDPQTPPSRLDSPRRTGRDIAQHRTIEG